MLRARCMDLSAQASGHLVLGQVQVGPSKPGPIPLSWAVVDRSQHQAPRHPHSEGVFPSLSPPGGHRYPTQKQDQR